LFARDAYQFVVLGLVAAQMAATGEYAIQPVVAPTFDVQGAFIR
jgi:hypothetical protein